MSIKHGNPFTVGGGSRARRRIAWTAGICIVGIGATAPHSGFAQRPSLRTSVTTDPAAVTAIVDVTIIPMDRERTLPGQTVLVQGGRITALGPHTTVRIPTGARRIDGRHKFLIPGLADMHVHLTEFTRANAEHALALLAANGVTTIRNMDYLPPWDPRMEKRHLNTDVVLQLRSQVAAGTLFGPTIYTSGNWAGGNALVAQLDSTWSTDSVLNAVRTYKAAGYDFVKIHDEKSKLFDAVVAAARRVGIPIAGHVPVGIALSRAFAAGYRSIEHFTGYLDPEPPDSVLALVRAGDSAAIRRIAEATQHAGVWNCPTLLLETLVDTTTHLDTVDAWPELQYVTQATRKSYRDDELAWRSIPSPYYNAPVAVRAQLIRALRDAGAGLLTGTDIGTMYLVPGFSLHRELQCLVHAGLTPYQALAASTRNVAEFFGTEAETGTVAIGKRADLVLLDANPLRDIRNTTHIAGVMLAGQWHPATELQQRLSGLVGTMAISN